MINIAVYVKQERVLLYESDIVPLVGDTISGFVNGPKSYKVLRVDYFVTLRSNGKTYLDMVTIEAEKIDYEENQRQF